MAEQREQEPSSERDAASLTRRELVTMGLYVAAGATALLAPIGGYLRPGGAAGSTGAAEVPVEDLGMLDGVPLIVAQRPAVVVRTPTEIFAVGSRCPPAIQAAKRTSELTPLCHPLALTNVGIDFRIDRKGSAVECVATASTVGRTGVEMEALTAVTAALLTIYDMCKAADRGMRLESIRLLEKQGGKSGHWVVQER